MNRLKCKEVCKRWYKLLMTRAIFRLDRHIYLCDCVIEPNRPPMSVFMAAKFPYDILTLQEAVGNTITMPLLLNLNETLAFWRHLTTITEIHFDIPGLYSPQLYEILYEMPQIQEMSTKNEFETLARRLFDMQKKYPHRKFLQNVKTIKIISCDIDVDSSESDLTMYLTKLRYILPACTEFIAEQGVVYGNLQLRNIVSTLQKIKIKCLMFEFYFDENWSDKKVMPALVKAEDLPIQTLKLEYLGDNLPSFELLKTLVDKHPHIDDVTLTCNFTVIPFPFTQLTEICFWGQDENPSTMGSLKWMEPLVNLRALEIRGYQNNCVFGHEIVNLPKLKKFSVKVKGDHHGLGCSNCFTALGNSFPNLNEFYGYFDSQDYLQILELMFTNWRCLRTMTVVFMRIHVENIAKCIENLKEQRLCLRSLQILSRIGMKCSGNDFLKMSQVFPDLTTLEIREIENPTDIEDVVNGIVPAFKDLTTLRIKSLKAPSSKMHVSKAFFEYLEQNGDSLRRLEIPDLSFDADLGARWLFQHMDKLCFFNDDERKLWMKQNKEGNQQKGKLK